MHRKERGLTILPISYSDLPRSENNLKCDLGTTLPFHMLYAGSLVNASKRSCYTENMAGNLKGHYDAKFLEAIGFAFKKCQFNFVPKAEQVQAIHAVVTGNDV